MTLEMWAHVAGIIEAAAVTAATVFTFLTVNAWRKQTVGKRKIEVAENAMLAFHELGESLKFIRTRLEVAPEEGSDAAFERHRSEYYNRMMASQALDVVLGGLAGQQPVFAVYFGQEAAHPFDSIIGATRALQADIRELFTFVPAEANTLKDKAIILNRIGWGDECRPDKRDREIEQAVLRMEELCKPVIEGRV